MLNTFSIGDIVLMRVGIADARMKIASGQACIPTAHCVVEILTQVCHGGGTQAHYVIRAHDGVQRLTGLELAPLSEWDAAKEMQALPAVPSLAGLRRRFEKLLDDPPAKD